MSNPSISMPDEMRQEIEDRRREGEEVTSVAKYVREALQARFDLEDAGEWEDPDHNPPKDTNNHEAPADD